MPNVVGLKEEAAVALIQDAGLEPDVQRAANADAEKGRVFDQNPNPGTRIQKGDRVTLLVSTGPPKTSVPDVVGMNYGDAVQALNDVNLKATKHEVFSQKPVGKVISQDPPAGEQVVEGTEIVLDVSRGAKQVAVPERRRDVGGQRDDDASAGGIRGLVHERPLRLDPRGHRLRPEPRRRYSGNQGLHRHASRSRAARARRPSPTRSARTSRWPSTT